LLKTIIISSDLSFKKNDNQLHLGAKIIHFSNARMHRKTSTEAEELLWNNLRNRRLKGVKFRRQHPISGYIADFYCHEERLVIEVDGEIHDLSEHTEHDEGRDFEFELQGIHVIRFRNSEILENIEDVLNRIIVILESRRLNS
jgi:very-short-patch-repair endonuclease